MSIKINGKNLNIHDKTYAYMKRKVGRINRVARNVTSIEVTIVGEHKEYAAEILVHADKKEFVAKHDGPFIRTTFDKALDKMTRQVRRNGDRLEDKRRRPRAAV